MLDVCSWRVTQLVPPWSAYFSPCGYLHGHLGDPVLKDIADLCWTQTCEFGGSKVQHWQPLSHLRWIPSSSISSRP
eukprot:5731708-Prorocentrum_lima.AAC.1